MKELLGLLFMGLNACPPTVPADLSTKGEPAVCAADQTLNVLCENMAAFKAAKLGEDFPNTWVDESFFFIPYAPPLDVCYERAGKNRHLFTAPELLAALGITGRTWIKSDEAIHAMYKLGYHPDGWYGLLALAAAQPDLQRKFLIVGLGSLSRWTQGRVFVPILLERGSERGFGYHWHNPEDRWHGHYRFLAVRK